MGNKRKKKKREVQELSSPSSIADAQIDGPRSGSVDQIFEKVEYSDQDFSRLVHYAEKLKRITFKRCRFFDLGLRTATVSECQFERCKFESTYLRDAEFVRTDLTGSEFYKCNLAHATFSNCKLWYVEFRECELNYESLLLDSVLPKEINQKRRVLRSLRINANSMGEMKAAERIHLLELKAERHESWAIFSGSSDYFRAKTSGYGKFKALVAWAWNHTENFIWGFGLRPAALLRTGVLLVLVFGIATFCLGSTFRVPNDANTGPTALSFFECVYVSTVNFSTLGLGDYQPASISAKIICMLEGTIGAVFLGLLAAAAYKKIVRK